MCKSTAGYCSRILVCLVFLSAANRAEAQPFDTVTFSGTGIGSSSGSFNGSFIYDQSQTGSNGIFLFSSKLHSITYTINGVQQNGTNTDCGAFEINTLGNVFVLGTICPKSPISSVTIVLPTTTTLSSSTLPPSSVFVTSPTAGATFTVVTPTSIFTGKISSVNLVLKTLPESNPITYVPALAEPCPVYAYQPPSRPGCCFARLFHRNRCW